MLAGADGCRDGWVLAVQRGGAIVVEVVEGARELLRRAAELEVLVADVPIGLADDGPRACDVESRRRLGRRGSCVFPAPVRACLDAATRAEASAISRAACGRGVGAQTWGILPRIRDVDRALAELPLSLRERIVEGHPELSFACLNGGAPVLAPKSSARGRDERASLLRRAFRRDVHALVERARAGRRSTVAPDDVLDALACLWTARRVAAGAAVSLPAAAERDARGLSMRIRA